MSNSEQRYNKVRAVIVSMLGVTVGINMLFIQSASTAMAGNASMRMQTSLASYVGQPETDAAISAIFEIIKPRGVPPVYGTVLGVSYDDPVAAMDIMRQYDPNQDPSILEANALARYIRIGLMISCEYCCSADTVVFDNGVSACGCAHAKAMRGLTRYLLEAFPSMTDDQILEEWVKWKTLFFPSDASSKALELTQTGTFNSATFLINNAS